MLEPKVKSSFDLIVEKYYLIVVVLVVILLLRLFTQWCNHFIYKILSINTNNFTVKVAMYFSFYFFAGSLLNETKKL